MVPDRIEVETGDVSAEQFRRSRFSVSPNAENRAVTLSLNEASCNIPFSDWEKFGSQVARRELKRWQFSNNVLPPMGSPEVRRMIARIVTTPAYQLFLSGIELANKIGLVTETDEDMVRARCHLLTNYVRSEYNGGLFFVQPQQLREVDTATLDELVDNNKLCIFKLLDHRPPGFLRYFIPYSTPNDFYAPAAVSHGARQLWDALRNLYYAFR